MTNKKLLAPLVAGVVAFLGGLVGSANFEAVSSARASSAPMAAKTSKKCKKRYVQEDGKCVLSKKNLGAEKKKGKEEEAKDRAEREKLRKKEVEAGRKREQAEARARQEEEEAKVIAGKMLFEATCAVCHGMEGEGVPQVAPAYGPELPRSESIKGVVEQLENPIDEKGCKCMESFSTKYTTAEKEELGAYITVDLTKKVKIGEV